MKKLTILTAAVALVLGMAFLSGAASAVPYAKGDAPQIEKEKQEGASAPACDGAAGCPMKDKKDAASCPMKGKKDAASCPMKDKKDAANCPKDKKDAACCAAKGKEKPAK